MKIHTSTDCKHICVRIVYVRVCYESNSEPVHRAESSPLKTDLSRGVSAACRPKSASFALYLGDPGNRSTLRAFTRP